MKIQPLKGMRDLLPAEQTLRDYIQGQILEVYRAAGFERISTPMLEDMENLDKSDGGENLNLIFKVLKRGDKLTAALNAGKYDALSDMGLRYDLTLPLSRYYAANRNVLPTPFKVIQTDRVFRAERPQKGRLREFVQCDIDILGDATSLAEIELILATTTALGKICPDNAFTVRINDREILRGMALSCGFAEESLEQVFITLDKMDKIGLEGVKAELLENGCSQESVDRYAALLSSVGKDAQGVRRLGEALEGVMPRQVTENLAGIMDTVSQVAETSFGLEFDPTLVRGMSYYTGTIFEVSMEGFGGSVAGGGRYDRMIGKFTGLETPACGFSIGFERIVTILLDNGFQVPGSGAKKAYLFEKGLEPRALAQVIREAMEERKAGVQVLVAQMNKNKRFQKEQLAKDGYAEFKEFYKEGLKR